MNRINSSLGSGEPSLGTVAHQGIRLGNRPSIPPPIVAGNKNVQRILRDLEKIKKAAKSTKVGKLHARSEELVYFIVNLVRNSKERDHLLETSVIWALISILRLEPHSGKAMMMSAGVPGALHTIIASPVLAATTRVSADTTYFFPLQSLLLFVPDCSQLETLYFCK